MSHPPVQHIKNHPRYVPLYHFVAVPILAVNFLDALFIAYRSVNWENALSVWEYVLGVLVAIALILIAVTVRGFANTVQDRVIRLEEQLRFERLFPVDLRARIPEFTRDQFVALRFASDDELPLLARTVLDQRITDRSAIKQMVQTWRADHLRA